MSMPRPHHDEAPDAPGAGVIRDCRAAKPDMVLDVHTRSQGGIEALTCGRAHRAMGSGDARPPVHRPGSLLAHQMPSRTGSVLRWPDGRLTDLLGHDLQVSA